MAILRVRKLRLLNGKKMERKLRKEEAMAYEVRELSLLCEASVPAINKGSCLVGFKVEWES